ncbi:hypothetical protein D5400_06900 [Georhizobium profundi]|uniref:Uncharacterized protein n=1 Tax=Georhizobium profundi TaxID=2341112 RepID=A0A3Q8XMI5_9HYPH|nr:hypothetical protein [Georhizobium profundi]AZN71040.1 hypothetical protein D5400_06900 [Georhizobium profundi]
MTIKNFLPTLALVSFAALPFAHAQQPMEGEGASETSNSQSIASDTSTADVNWSDELRGAFFTDETLRTVRSDEEIQTNFADLDAEQQASIREDCEAAGVSAASTGEPEGTAPSSATDPDSQAVDGVMAEEANPTTPAPTTSGSVGINAQSSGSIGSASTPAGPDQDAGEDSAEDDGQEAEMTRMSLIQICQRLPAQ